MKKELEIEQSVSFSQEDFSSDMKNNIAQAIDPTGNVLAIDTWKYAIYFFDKILLLPTKKTYFCTTEDANREVLPQYVEEANITC